MHNWWPEHPTKSFFAGKPASCVLGVRNIGSSTLNVTYALANLASPYNASMNLYNFTSQVRSRHAAIPRAVLLQSPSTHCSAICPWLVPVPRFRCCWCGCRGQACWMPAAAGVLQRASSRRHGW